MPNSELVIERCYCSQVSILAGPQELLLSTVKRRKLSWFGHICRHDTLLKFMLQGYVDGRRRRGRPRKSWKGQLNGIDRPVIVVVATHRKRQKSIGDIAADVRRTLGRHGR